MERATSLVLFTLLALSAFTQTVPKVSVPCYCTSYDWSEDDSLGWRFVIAESIEYNVGGYLIKHSKLNERGDTSSYRITTYSKGSLRSEDIDYSISKNNSPSYRYRKIVELDKYGNKILQQDYTWKNGKWSFGEQDFAKSTFTYNSSGNLVNKINYYYPREWQSRRNILFTYNSQGQIAYILYGEDTTYKDSITYDYSRLATHGDIEEIAYIKSANGKWYPNIKNIRNFDRFRFPKKYITGDEYSDTALHLRIEVSYKWASPNWGMFDEESYQDPAAKEHCNDCKWLPRLDSTFITHLDYGGTIVVHRSHFGLTSDSTYEEHDSHGNITKREEYNFDPVKNPNAGQPVVYKIVAANIIHYQRTYDVQGNEVDLVISGSNKVGSPIRPISRTKCTKYKTVPKTMSRDGFCW